MALKKATRGKVLMLFLSVLTIYIGMDFVSRELAPKVRTVEITPKSYLFNGKVDLKKYIQSQRIFIKDAKEMDRNDKVKIDQTLRAARKWMHDHPFATNDEYLQKYVDVLNVCRPISVKYSDNGHGSQNILQVVPTRNINLQNL